MQTNLNVTSLDGENKKSTKAITYVNPNSTNAQLKTLAQKFTAISTNNYQDAERINRMSVEEPYTPPVQKTEPTLSITSASNENISIQNQDITQKTITYSYNGDGTISANSNDGYCMVTQELNKIEFIPYNAPTQGGTYPIKIFASEGTNYAAKQINYSIIW